MTFRHRLILFFVLVCFVGAWLYWFFCCRNSNMFKSMEEKVGGAYTNVKVRVVLHDWLRTVLIGISTELTYSLMSSM